MKKFKLDLDTGLTVASGLFAVGSLIVGAVKGKRDQQNVIDKAAEKAAELLNNKSTDN